MKLIVLHGGRETELAIEREGDHFVVQLSGNTYRVERDVATRSLRTLLVEGRQYEVGVDRLSAGRYRVSSAVGTEIVDVLDPLAHLAAESHAGKGSKGLHSVEAYMPGRVVTVLVEEGEQVAAGQGLVVLEAMKMENEIQAERPGVVRRIFIAPGQAVEGGDPMFELE